MQPRVGSSSLRTRYVRPRAGVGVGSLAGACALDRQLDSFAPNPAQSSARYA